MKTKSSVESYVAFAEAVRNAFLSPAGFRTTGAAFWKLFDREHLRQVGGNVGKGRSFSVKDLDENTGGRHKIYVWEAMNTGEWMFFNRRNVAVEHILCYPLIEVHVLPVHISGAVRVKAVSSHLPAVERLRNALQGMQFLSGLPPMAATTSIHSGKSIVPADKYEHLKRSDPLWHEKTMTTK